MNTEGLQKRNRDTADIVHDNDPTQQKYVAKAYRKSAEVVKKPGVPSLIVAVALPLVAGMVVSMFNGPSQWYKDLNKPAWTPPGPIFGLIWTFIYPIMGLASWLVWADGGFQRNAFPLGAYFVQLGLNLMCKKRERVCCHERAPSSPSLLPLLLALLSLLLLPLHSMIHCHHARNARNCLHSAIPGSLSSRSLVAVSHRTGSPSHIAVATFAPAALQAPI